MKIQNITVAAILGLGTVLGVTGCGTSSVSAKGPTTGLASYFSSSHQVVIPQGTIVRIRTSTTLSTRDARTGQTARASLEAPLISANGTVLAPRGAEATLVVASSDPGGRVKGRAQIGLRLTSMQVAGINQSVSTNIAWHQARATKGKDAAKIGILGGIGAAIGALAGGGKGAAIGAGAGAGAGTAVVLSTHGDAAVVPAESVLQFRLEQPLTVTVKG